MNTQTAGNAFYDQLYQEINESGLLLPLGLLLQRAAQRFGATPALIYQDQTTDYKTLFLQAWQISCFLAGQGVKTGDRIMLIIENSPFFYQAYFAVAQLGCVVVPLNIFLTPAELTHIVNDCKPRLIITSAALKSMVDFVADIKVLTPDNLMLQTTIEEPQVRWPQLSSDKMALLLYTSGTTGLPKGVMLSNKNIMINMIQCIAKLGFESQERVFAILPLFHSFAQNTCVWAAIFLGCTIIVVAKIDRRALLNGLKHKPTLFLGVPALFGLLCLLKNAPLESVNYFASGGDAMSDKIRSAFALIYNRKIANGYGMTETSPVIAADLDDCLEPAGCVGTPVIGLICSIQDEQGNVLPDYQVGEICVKGDNVMLGYYNAPEATKKIIYDGWLHTGDLGYRDHQGKIVISGRAKDLISNKGIKIYPQEVENVLLGHQAVIRVAVIGRVHETEGEIPIAYVQVKQCTAQLPDELRIWCASRLAPYKIPREFICQIEDLPLTATGKVDKKILKVKK
jgi:long-chain acyl-CoA synthetase